MNEARMVERKIEERGGRRVGLIGYLGGAMYQGWTLNGSGFVLASKDGKAEIYTCACPSTAPVAEALALIDKMADGKSEEAAE